MGEGDGDCLISEMIFITYLNLSSKNRPTGARLDHMKDVANDNLISRVQMSPDAVDLAIDKNVTRHHWSNKAASPSRAFCVRV